MPQPTPWPGSPTPLPKKPSQTSLSNWRSGRNSTLICGCPVSRPGAYVSGFLRDVGCVLYPARNSVFGRRSASKRCDRSPLASLGASAQEGTCVIFFRKVSTTLSRVTPAQYKIPYPRCLLQTSRVAKPPLPLLRRWSLPVAMPLCEPAGRSSSKTRPIHCTPDTTFPILQRGAPDAPELPV